MSSSGPSGPATDPSRRSRRGSTSSEGGLRAFESMAQPQPTAGQQPETARNKRRPAHHAHRVRHDAAARRSPHPSAAARHSRPRPGSTTQRSTFDESGLSAIGKQMRQFSLNERKARRRSHRVRRILLGATAFIVLLAGGAFGYDWYLNHEIHRIDRQGSFCRPGQRGRRRHREHPDGRVHRPGADSQQNAAYGSVLAGGERGQQRRGHDPPPRPGPPHTVSILSIPRDLFIPNARTTGANKIDAALYQGPSAVGGGHPRGLRHPHPALRGAQFRHLRQRGRRPGRGQDVLPRAGLRRLLRPEQSRPPGACTSTASMPSRWSGPDTSSTRPPGVTSTDPTNWPAENQSDLARIRRDHEFLRVLATAVAKNGLSNPITDYQLVSGVAPQLDGGPAILPARTWSAWSSTSTRSTPTRPPSSPCPVEVDQCGVVHVRGRRLRRHRVPVDRPGPAGHRPVPAASSPETDTMHGGTLPAPGTVSVSVLNGSGAYNQATDTSSSLQALGFQMAGIGDTPSVASQVGDGRLLRHTRRRPTRPPPRPWPTRSPGRSSWPSGPPPTAPR